jgi:hypothetical protein
VGAEAATDAPSGVSLAQYAAMRAALAEPFPLDEALVAHGVDPGAWPDADLAWTQRLVDDEAALGAYRAELAGAEDRLSRRITPLDDDLAGWVGFLNAFSTSGEPGGTLAQAGLGPNDIARLSRRWGRRLEQEAALQKRAAELLKTPGPMPRVSAEPAALPRGRVEAPRAPSAQPAGAADPGGIDRYAMLRAELDAFPGETTRTLRKYGIAGEDAVRALDQQWSALLADPALGRDYRALYAHASAQLVRARQEPVAERREPVSAPIPAAIVVLPGRDGAGLTVDVGAIFEGGPALPFAPEAVAPSQALEGALAHAASVQGPAPAAAAGGTMDVGALFDNARAALRADAPVESGVALALPTSAAAATTVDVSALLESGPALPFAAEPRAPSQALAGAKAHAAEVQGPALAAGAGAGGTMDVGALFESGAALPFPAGPAPAGTAAVTMDVGALFESGAALPFAPERPSPSQAPASAAAQARGAAPAAGAGGTMDVGALFESGAALPFPAAAAAAAPQPPVPELSLEQYASLCVELHLHPDRAAAIVARYHLSTEAAAAIDARWRARIGADASLGAAFAGAYASYRAWLLAQRR